MVDGAKCAGCVSKIEKALNQVPGVSSATMSLAQGMAMVNGTASADSLILALNTAGYQARVDDSASEAEAMDEKEKQDAAYYGKLMRHMWMAWGWESPDDLWSGHG